MTKTVDQLVAELITREGGYVDHPADRGGPTRFGITQAVARAEGYAGAMSAFPRETAAAIYRRLYWTRPGFKLVAVRAPAIAAELFDTGVNMGPAVAVGFLQRALNALNRGAKDYPDLAEDGRIGPGTLAALDGYLRARGAAGERVLLKALEALQGERYVALAERRPANEAFVYGWLAHRVGLALAILCLFVLPLGGCATSPGGYPKARTTLERIEDAYLRVRAPAEMAIERLPEPARSRAASALVLADAALAVVRSDASPLERAAAARQLVRAAAGLAGYSSTSGGRGGGLGAGDALDRERLGPID